MNHALIVFTVHWENGCYNLVVGCLSLHFCGCIHPFIILCGERGSYRVVWILAEAGSLGRAMYVVE